MDPALEGLTAQLAVTQCDLTMVRRGRGGGWGRHTLPEAPVWSFPMLFGDEMSVASSCLLFWLFILVLGR